MLEELGVEFRFNIRYGRDIHQPGEPHRRAASRRSSSPSAPTSPSSSTSPARPTSPRSIESIDLLRRVALGDRRSPGRRAVIVGGGNVAIDAARTCLRLGSEEVTIAYRRTRAEMPADIEEVEQAEDEGIHLALLTIPKAVMGRDGRLTGLQCIRAKLVKKRRQRAPVPGARGGQRFRRSRPTRSSPPSGSASTWSA